MGSSQDDRQPHPGAASQPGLFNDVDSSRAGRREVHPGVSANPDLHVEDTLNHYHAHMPESSVGNNGSDTIPVAIAPAPEDTEPIWVRRLKLVLFVLFCIELGMLLAVLPWTKVWTENSLLLPHPDLRALLKHDFVRGCVTGLGLIDIWLGIREAVNYKEKQG